MDKNTSPRCRKHAIGYITNVITFGVLYYSMLLRTFVLTVGETIHSSNTTKRENTEADHKITLQAGGVACRKTTN